MKPKLSLDSDTRREEIYNQYLTDHISNVNLAWKLARSLIENDPNSDISPEILDRVSHDVASHDKSKYTIDEYYPYLNHFYPLPGAKDNSLEFDQAVLHHYRNNSHHYQYHVLIRDSDESEGYPIVEALDMPDYDVLHMLADWNSFSAKDPSSTAVKWYCSHGDSMLLSSNTRKLIVKYLKYFISPIK